MIRLCDVLGSFFGLLILSPLLFLIGLWISLDSRGGVFFRQTRVGRGGREFQLLKFRTMRPDSETKGQLTVGMRDPRITTVGAILRKYKLDEFPQLINVLKGEMSVVGPRPEVPKYVALYDERQREVLKVRPGITDTASLEYFEENRLLAESENPEETYVKDIMPAKIALNMEFIERPTLAHYLSIILRTVGRVIS